MNFVQFVATKTFLKHLGVAVLIFIILSWAVLASLGVYTKHGESANVPDFNGLTMDQIAKLESSKDFELVVIDSVYDASKRKGTVISQEPQPRSHVKAHRKIYLTLVASLPEQVSMPDLVDLSLRQATAILQTYGLKLGSISQVADIANNAVLRQLYHGRTIIKGKFLTKGSTIDLVVGSGLGGDKVQIPFLIGKTRQEAIMELRRFSLNVGTETYDQNTDSIDARVYEQEPHYTIGRYLNLGNPVNLIFRSSLDFDFDSYIRSYKVDTLRPDSLSTENNY
ncbi:MAG: PASTA domain-containing protein [Bacteroidales bacterium]